MTAEAKKGCSLRRLGQKYINQKTIDMLKKLILMSSPHTPSYEQTAMQLNILGYSTSRGNPWTPKRLFRMLQRNGVRGIHGLCASMKTQAATLITRD